MARKPHNGLFKAGSKGGPGRPPILLPEVQKAIDANRNAIKVLVLQKLDTKVEQWIDRIIEQGIGEGDVNRFKILLEIALGKIIHENPQVELSPDESVLLTEYRRRKKEETETKNGAG